MFDRICRTNYNIFSQKTLHQQKIKKGQRCKKSTGIIRKVDELGRVVLPIEIRRTLDLADRDELEIYLDGDKIILQKFEPSCIFCSSSRMLIQYQGMNVCQECIKIMHAV